MDRVLLQIEEPLVGRLIDDHRQVVGHHEFVASCCSDGDLVSRQPLYRIVVAVVRRHLVDLEVPLPDDSAE